MSTTVLRQPEEINGEPRAGDKPNQTAQDLVNRLNSDENVTLPDGVTKDTLQNYGQVAQDAVLAERIKLALRF